jgi:SAM-dependent methyltransferase
MTHEFDKDYWETHWQQAKGNNAGQREIAPHPYLAREISNLTPGTALDAGCGEGIEAIWLANKGWNVVAADISSEVLARAADRATHVEAATERLRWVEADLSTWEPGEQFDLVATHYAHPAIPQLEFYKRIANWVAPGGTLLIVGHLHTHGHEHQEEGRPPEEATATANSITAGLDPTQWLIITVDETTRTVTKPNGQEVQLDDVIVRATRTN